MSEPVRRRLPKAAKIKPVEEPPTSVQPEPEEDEYTAYTVSTELDFVNQFLIPHLMCILNRGVLGNDGTVDTSLIGRGGKYILTASIPVASTKDPVIGFRPVKTSVAAYSHTPEEIAGSPNQDPWSVPPLAPSWTGATHASPSVIAGTIAAADIDAQTVVDAFNDPEVLNRNAVALPEQWPWGTGSKRDTLREGRGIIFMNDEPDLTNIKAES